MGEYSESEEAVRGRTKLPPRSNGHFKVTVSSHIYRFRAIFRLPRRAGNHHRLLVPPVSSSAETFQVEKRTGCLSGASRRRHRRPLCGSTGTDDRKRRIPKRRRCLTMHQGRASWPGGRCDLVFPWMRDTTSGKHRTR